MGMVVLLHCTTHGIRNAQISSFTPVWWMVCLLNSFSLPAVNCFVLISGYYLCTHGPRLGKILALWVQVFTYSLGIYLALCAIPGSGTVFSLKELLRHALPMLSNQYWFFKYYLLLILLSPILNHLLLTLDRKSCKRTLLGLLLIFSAMPSINIFGDTFGAAQGYSLIWFSLLYLMGGYLKKFPPKKRPYGRYFWLSCLMLCIIRTAGAGLGGIFGSLSALQLQYNSPLVFSGSVCLFLWALNGPGSFGPRTDRVLRKTASLSFGIYLLHDHGAVSDILWNSRVCLWAVAEDPLRFAVRILAALCAIFACGLAAEWLRAALMGWLFPPKSLSRKVTP